MRGREQAAFRRIAEAVFGGASLDVALQTEPQVFEPWAVKILALGVASGTLARAFDEVADAF